jgi:hypothetical protein
MATSNTGPKKATAGTGSTNQGAKTTPNTTDLAAEITQAFTDAAHAARPTGGSSWRKCRHGPKPRLSAPHDYVVPAHADPMDSLRSGGPTLLGPARRAPGHTWAVMADPEGNEFCVR